MNQSSKNGILTNQTAHELKIPSADVVTIDNLWQVVQAIAATSTKFTQEQLRESDKTLPPINTLFRILAYLKYLNYLRESREEETQGGKKVKLQYFIVNKDLPLVQEIQYQIKAGRKEDAKELWLKLIREHDLTQIIIKDFFSSEDTKTRLDLENFLKGRSELSGKTPSYYQHGVTFILKLLNQAQILSTSGNNIYYKSSVQAEKDDQDKPEESLNSNNTHEDDQKISTYKVVVTGPGLNASIQIGELFDIEIVEKYLEKIKKNFTS